MKLDRVTITGADDSIDPYELVVRSKKYPFVEWGILASRSQDGTPRFPTASWISNLQSLRWGKNGKLGPVTPQLALHVCGGWVRQLLKGDIGIPVWMLDGFDRIQLNFHALDEPCEFEKFYEAIWSLTQDKKREIIFQLDGAKGNSLFVESLALNKFGLNLTSLYDVSGGAGVLPCKWPAARELDYQGYAGGLGPDNLEEQLTLIAGVSGNQRIWIDMESRVRSDEDQQFDLELVDQVLATSAKHVTTPAS